MSIPENALTTYPPLPYEELRGMVRDGDILLCQGRDPFSRLIQWSTKSPWSHIAIAFKINSLDQIVVVESVEKIGVRCVAFAEFLSRDSEGTSPYPGKILLTRHAGLAAAPTDPGVRALAKFAFDHLGCRFASGEIVKIALRIISSRILGNKATPKMLLPDDEFICSEFVAKAFQEAGLKVPWDGLGFIAPSDFADDPQIEPLGQADVTHPPRPRHPA